MQNILDEGKVQISASASLKDRIEGVQFSSQGYEVWLTKIVNEEDEKEQARLLDETANRLVTQYYKKLEQEIKSTRNDMIDTLRVELDKEYREKLQKAKEIIIELKEQVKKQPKLLK